MKVVTATCKVIAITDGAAKITFRYHRGKWQALIDGCTVKLVDKPKNCQPEPRRCVKTRLDKPPSTRSP